MVAYNVSVSHNSITLNRTVCS